MRVRGLTSVTCYPIKYVVHVLLSAIFIFICNTALQLATLATGLVTGKGVESLQTDMHRAKVPWLELHAPGGIQVRL